MAAATPAGAIVTEVEGVKVGIQSRNGATLGTPGEELKTFNNNSGNPVVRGNGDYAIYWDPAKQFHHEWLVKLDGFFQGLGEAELGTPFADLSQYRDRSNAITPFKALFKGAYSDTSKFPVAGCTDPHSLEVGAVTCLTSAQLREQLQAFIATHALPKGMNTVYYLLTPPGVTVCLDAAGTHCSDYQLTVKEQEEEKRESTSYKNSFCSYHDAINPGGLATGDANAILYAAIPWTAGTSGLSGYKASSRTYASGFDCQDGGWNPEENKETREKPRELTKAEKEAIEKDAPKLRAEEEERLRVEGPHQQEPNQEPGQEGKGELGDYSAGLADILINQIAVQQMNIVTDPMLNAWQDAKGNEVTDLCRNVFAFTAGPTGGSIEGSVKAGLNTEAGSLSNISLGSKGRYYVNNVFNLAEERCSGGVGLVPRFTAPNPVNAGEIIGVDGMESTITMIRGQAFGPTGPPTTTYATVSWNFGDGTPEVQGFAPGAPTCEVPWLSPCAASAFHAYQYGGTYNATLTVTDVGGDRSAVSHAITVVGPPPPAPPAPPSSTHGSGSSASGASAAGGAGSASVIPPVPSPIATDAVLSHSLRSVMKNGVVVRYAVNEQVAGHLEVLLSRALARRLGVIAPAAVGLPLGSAPQVVVGKAIIVTTTGGHSSVVIQLSKRTAQRLNRLRKVTLMLRLVVRNAAAHGPLTTTVLSEFTLTR
jgi:hypothetical protein